MRKILELMWVNLYNDIIVVSLKIELKINCLGSFLYKSITFI